MKIAIFTPAPYGCMPSQRFRFEHYLTYLKESKIDFDYLPFYDKKSWDILYKKGHKSSKIIGILKNLSKRFFQIFTLGKYDFVFIHREMAPIGPPFFEWISAKIFRKKIIYDFDDAIWINQSSEANPNAEKIKCAWKVKHICSYSYCVSVGNSFLKEYASAYAKKVKILPTVVDTQNIHIPTSSLLPSKRIVIGWTGTFTNFYNLNLVNSAIAKLQCKYDFEYRIISNKDPMFKDVTYIFKPWNKSTEIVDLQSFSIGIMPLEDSDLEKGKCAFKAIQYMSLCVPAVVSPVGANCDVVEHGLTGFWARDPDEWYLYLEKLITDNSLRERFGKKSRNFIVENYSVESSKEIFLNFFK